MTPPKISLARGIIYLEDFLTVTCWTGAFLLLVWGLGTLAFMTIA